MLNKSILLTLALTSIMSGKLFAHADHDKARFVATNGSDKGNCNNPVRPCQSIAYAVSQASKGDKVLVASGQYRLNNESELFYLESELVPVIGGFNRFDHFQVQNPDVNQTTILGAPKSLHETLHKAGFKVVADGKSLSISKDLKQKLARHQALFKKQSNQSCVNGQAGSFSCDQVDLVAHVPLPNGTSGNDIWGHTDLNTGIEYALMGFSDGTRIYSLENPSNPVLVAFINANFTTWRDIKVLQHFDNELNTYRSYAYISAEDNNDIQVVDLNNLPESASLIESDISVRSAHNVYISNVDYSYNLPLNGQTPALQILGSDKFGGAFTSFSLNTPNTPAKNFDIGVSDRANYTHDATSVLIDDERANRDCQNAINGRCDVFIDFNESEIRIWDTTAPEQTIKLGEVGYDDVSKANQYIHSGWWHENKRHVYVHDEFDENRAGLNTTVRILDLIDLSNPVVVGKWTSNNRTIDHNGFVKGNRYYMSNYERGLTILDISDPINPVKVGFFDTFPSSDNPSFNGAWGAYPYLPSGNILVSDINSGLYVLKDKTRENTTQVNFETTAVNIERGQELRLLVTKPSSEDTVASIDFDILNGSAQIESDVVLLNDANTLTWQAGDTNPKVIGLQIPNNGESNTEQFFVRLHNASSNIQIGDNRLMSVVINGELSAGKVGFVESELTLSETRGEVELSLSRVGGTASTITFDYDIEFLSASADDVSFTSGTVSWSEGDADNKTISFTLNNDDLTEQDEQFIIKLINNDSDLLATEQILVTITDDESNNAPEVYAGNDIELATNSTVTLSAAVVNDGENTELTYQWQQVSGVPLTLGNSERLAATITASNQAGTAVVSLSATDQHGATTTDELTVTVVAPVTPEPSSSSSGGSLPLWLLSCFTLLVLRRKTH